jgi:hypothetical protein
VVNFSVYYDIMESFKSVEMIFFLLDKVVSESKCSIVMKVLFLKKIGKLAKYNVVL